MAIYLPGTAEDQELALDDLTPREIVAELDKYVVGQKAAKRAVAIALRNRMRRQKLPPDLAEEIMPKNIIMIGPTGVGKTEIARRLAKLTNSPFLKVEASKFTEVGYVGRDVEAIVRDLAEIAIDMVREEKLEEVEDKAELNAEERLLDLLLGEARRIEAGDIVQDLLPLWLKFRAQRGGGGVQILLQHRIALQEAIPGLSLANRHGLPSLHPSACAKRPLVSRLSARHPRHGPAL